MSEKVTIQVDSLTWDGIEWSALHYVDKILAHAGLEFEMSVEHWTKEGDQGTGFLYRDNKLVAYLRDGNLARLTCNTTGVELPEVVEVVEKGES
jgi:hypothetical protein